MIKVLEEIMANILLLEPNYSAKYPPLGLMKISYYHKFVRKDNIVVFAKGRLSDNSPYKEIKWDRIYVSTMFTYEWKETIKTIKYAKDLVSGNTSKIIVGGIASTLMAEDFEKETGIKPITGLLNETGKLGYEDDAQVDSLPPDFSMLDDVSYRYEAANNYFAYTTRGCGMNCSFCAVKTLEPTYINRVSISKQIEQIRAIDMVDDKPGELKKDLLLLDNNVLRSKLFPEIIEEIKMLGFQKGATFCNQRTGKQVKRYVDFNQGLDANLLTKRNAELLGTIALRPARIAFDHIEDADQYRTAILRCVDAGITNFSNYILYNAEVSSGKGKQYSADMPDDLYKRLIISIDLMDEINRDSHEKVTIYSFPMRFIPLNAKDRSFIGPNWNKKYLRTIQVMLNPTMGKGVSNRSYFYAAFGKNVEEFSEFLLMPEFLLLGRGRIKSSSKARAMSHERLHEEHKNEVLIRRWREAYNRLKNKERWVQTIADNDFNPSKFFLLDDIADKKLFLFYLSTNQFLELINNISSKQDRNVITEFCREAPEYYQGILTHINEKHYNYRLLEKGFYNLFGKKGIDDLIIGWIDTGCKDPAFLNNLENLVVSVRTPHIDIDALKAFFSFYLLGILDLSEHNHVLMNSVMNEDYDNIWQFLYEQEILLDKLIDEKGKSGETSEVLDVLYSFKDQLHNRLF